MDYLALQVREFDPVKINDAELPYTRGGKIQSYWRSQPACSHAQYAGGADFLLALQANFGQD
jgi:hypothetical protein